jgi:hypothetical protein
VSKDSRRRKRKAAKKRRAQAALPKMLRGLSLIYAAIGQRELTDRVRFVIHQRGVPRKLVILGFARHTPDLYLILPYLNVVKTYYSLMHVPARTEYFLDLEADERVESTQSRLKLSYHESGQLHVRPQTDTRTPILRSVAGLPLVLLSGEHVFSIELDGIDAFAPAKKRELQQPETVAIALSPPARRIRLIGYAGSTPEQVSGKYGVLGKPATPSVTVKFVRPSLPSPLYVGIYIMAGKSLMKNPSSGSVEIAMLHAYGFDGEVRHIHTQGFTAGAE